MLQTMRHLAQSWVFKGLMLILVVSFGIWGIGDIFRGNPMQRSVAQAGDMAITAADLDRDFRKALTYMHRVMGPDLTEQQAKQMGLLNTALDTAIEHAELQQELTRLGIEASDKAVLQYVSSSPRFQDKDGKFDKNMFYQFMEQAGLSEKEFTGEIAQSQLLGVFKSNTAAPQLLADDLYKARGQKRILEIVTLKNSSVGGVAKPDDAALHDFYQKNPKPFTAPEYRGITIARLATDDVAKDIIVGDDQLQKAYADQADSLTPPEKRDFLQAIVQDEAKAKALAAKAQTSGDLASASKALGAEASPLKDMDEKSMFPELAKPAFTLGAGQISDPVHTDLGWHVVQVKKIVPSRKPSFNEVKDQLREAMKRDQAVEETTRLVNQLDDSLAANRPLEDIADALKLHLVKIPALDAKGVPPDAEKPADIPSKADVLKAAFGQNAGEASPILDDKQGNYVVVRTDQVTPSAVKPFDKVKDQVAAAWARNEQAKRAGTEAEKIAASLRSGKSAASVAAASGAEVRLSKPVSQLDDKDASLPQTLLPQIFRMKKGDVIVSPQPDQQFVLRLTEIRDADASGGEKAKVKITEGLAGSMPEEFNEEYSSYLRTIFPVEIDRDAFEAINQQGGG